MSKLRSTKLKESCPYLFLGIRNLYTYVWHSTQKKLEFIKDKSFSFSILENLNVYGMQCF